MITLLVIYQQALLIQSWIFGFGVLFLICLSQFISIFHMLVLFFLHKYRTSPFHILPYWHFICKLVIDALVCEYPVRFFCPQKPVLSSQTEIPCPLCIFLSRFISDVSTQLVKCESKVILKLRFSWHPCCLHTFKCNQNWSSGAPQEWLRQRVLSRGDPGSGNCSHEHQASAHSACNILHKSCDKHSGLLTEHKSEVSLFSYTCEHVYVHNISEEVQATLISEGFHLLIFGKELNVVSYVEGSFESPLQNHSEQACWLFSFSWKKFTKL